MNALEELKARIEARREQERIEAAKDALKYLPRKRYELLSEEFDVPPPLDNAIHSQSRLEALRKKCDVLYNNALHYEQKRQETTKALDSAIDDYLFEKIKTSF